MTTARVEPDPGRLALLDAMVDQSALDLGGDDARQRAVRALALTFDRHRIGSKHAALVGAAMRARTPAERHAGPRPRAESAVRALVRRGELPYQRAVDAELERWDAAAAARQARQERLAERGGLAAARVVADLWRRTGRAPSAARVGQKLGWSRGDSEPVCRLLVQAGQLHLSGSGGLRPGSRARRKVAV